MTAVTIMVTRKRIARSRVAGPGRSASWYWHYYAERQGTRFDNSSLVELRGRLRAVYGQDIRIIEAWKEQR